LEQKIDVHGYLLVPQKIPSKIGGICCYHKNEIKSTIKVLKGNPYNQYIGLNIIFEYNNRMFFTIFYFAFFNSAFYKNPNVAIDHPFINLENDIATLETHDDILLLGDFNARIGRAPSNILNL
jgi:hypothetical protein